MLIKTCLHTDGVSLHFFFIGIMIVCIAFILLLIFIKNNSKGYINNTRVTNLYIYIYIYIYILLFYFGRVLSSDHFKTLELIWSFYLLQYMDLISFQIRSRIKESMILTRDDYLCIHNYII